MAVTGMLDICDCLRRDRTCPKELHQKIARSHEEEVLKA